jgi:hypothetical protein
VTTVSTTTLVNLANKQISVQVRGGALHLAIDVVGFFRAPNGGFVSSVTAGAGLTGGGTGAVSLAVNTSTIQSRVTATCAVGSFIRAIASNGTVTCGTPPVETLYAVVASDGTLQRGVGVTAANRVGVAGSGTYEVIFNRDVRACVFTATLGGGTIATFLGEVNATGRAGDVNGVFVDTNNSDGTAADKGFHLLVNC